MSDRHAIMDNRNQPEAAAISNSTRSGTRPSGVNVAYPYAIEDYLPPPN